MNVLLCNSSWCGQRCDSCQKDDGLNNRKMCALSMHVLTVWFETFGNKSYLLSSTNVHHRISCIFHSEGQILTLQIECWFHISRLCVVNDSNSERYQNAASLQVKKWFKGLGTPKIPSTHFETNDLIAPNYTMKRTTEPTIQKWKLGLKKKDPMLHKDKEWKYNITHYEMMLSE